MVKNITNNITNYITPISLVYVYHVISANGKISLQKNIEFFYTISLKSLQANQ